MKKQQEHLQVLNTIRAKQNRGELYASLYDVFNELQRNDSKLVGILDKKIAGGDFESVEDIADWFLARFYEEQKDAEQLIKML